MAGIVAGPVVDKSQNLSLLEHQMTWFSPPRSIEPVLPLMSRVLKKWLPIVLQSLVSLAFLVWIFGKPGLREQALKVLANSQPGWLLAGFLVAGSGCFVGVIRWGIFLRLLGIHLRGWELLRLSFIGLFFNNFLVGAIGGDAVKVVWLGAKGHSKTRALLSVLMDRMSGLAPLVVCSLAFILLRLGWLMQSPVVAGVIKFVFAFLAGMVILLAISFVGIKYRGPDRMLPQAFPGREQLKEFTDAYMLFLTAWRQTLLASLLSAVILIGHFLTFYCSARAFGVNIPVMDFFAFMPAVDIISALPISLGGLGVREQLFVTLLGDLCKVPEAQAVSISLAGALLSIVWGLFGLALLPAYHKIVEQQKEA